MRPIYVLIFVVLAGWITFLSVSDGWNKDRIQNDVLEYYSYLPATFICKDIALKNKCEGRYWTTETTIGGKVFRMTMGMSMVYLPFFTIAHFAAPIFHENQDGYSDPYQKMILFAGLFYALLGLIFTFKSLKFFFTERVAFITSCLIFFSTNLLLYTTTEPGMSHAFLFGLGSLFIYLVIKWHEEVNYLRTIAIGLILGLMILIRPTSILFFIIFLFYNIKTKQEFVEKVSLLFKNYVHLLVIGVCVFLVLSPQLMYWKYVTGNWVYYSYGNQTFFWKTPHIIDGLFSFRKGWFIYTPIMLLACFGIFKIKKHVHSFLLPLIVFLPIFGYVMFCWWCWWYGGSYGQRSFIDIYCLMAFPLAGIISTLSEQKVAKRLLIFCCILLITLNVFQSWQYSKGIIHFDSMTKEAYLLSFGMTNTTSEYYNSLWQPDYIRASQGKSECFEPEELYTSTIAIKASNLKLLSLRNADTLIADTFEDRHLQHFIVEKINDNEIALRAFNNKFLSVDKNRQNGLFAKADSVGETEKFKIEFLSDNYIYLIASNKKYVRFNSVTNLLVADVDFASINSRLRILFEK